jgi:hypothetical protein
MAEKDNRNMVVVAINIAILVLYTLYIRLTSPGGESVLIVALLIAFHFLLCAVIGIICAAIVPAKKYTNSFLLSALAVLLIGFSTCYLAYAIY